MDTSLTYFEGAKNPQKIVTRRSLSRRSAGPKATELKPRPVVNFVPAAQLSALIATYIEDCRLLGHSKRTIGNKRDRLFKLPWFAAHCSLTTIGPDEVRAFFLYLHNGHKESCGRWGRKHETEELKPSSIKSYYNTLRAFFTYLVEQDTIASSPMSKMKPPIDRADQVQPFTAHQIVAMYNAAKLTAYPERDTALILVLLNTGIRVSELCDLTWEDLDMQEGLMKIRNGKGGKQRIAPLSTDTIKTLYAHYETLEDPLPTDAVFISERGTAIGAPLGRMGAYRVILRISKRAKITGVRASPHTFRHTFAVTYLRPADRGGYGGNVFALKQILGHVSLTMTNRYVALAEADITAQHKTFSPIRQMRQAVKRK